MTRYTDEIKLKVLEYVQDFCTGPQRDEDNNPVDFINILQLIKFIFFKIISDTATEHTDNLFFILFIQAEMQGV